MLNAADPSPEAAGAGVVAGKQADEIAANEVVLREHHEVALS